VFEELLELAETKLRENGGDPSYEAVINLASAILIEDTKYQEETRIKSVVSEHDAFIKRNRERWSVGFRKLRCFSRQLSSLY